MCREWADTVTLGAEAAELDLAPDAPAATLPPGADAGADDAARRALFFRRCPFVADLTYHVSPGVTLAKVRRRGRARAHGAARAPQIADPSSCGCQLDG